MTLKSLFRIGSLDRRLLYALIALSLAWPLVTNFSVQPAHMHTADAYYAAVEQLPLRRDKIVLLAFDWGPSTQAENLPQTEVTIEHLMRRRVPFATISITPYAAPFMESLPRQVAARLAKETGRKIEYGKAWVNFGYQPGSGIMIQSLAKSKDLQQLLKTDANGTPLKDIPVMREIKTIRNVAMLAQITGLIGAFSSWIQFFQTDSYRPPVVHGCTSITIPEAHIYFSSKQIVGLFEGVAGAAWYEKLLGDNHPQREIGDAMRTNTSLAVAQLLIVLFIILGNIGSLLGLEQERKE